MNNEEKLLKAFNDVVWMAIRYAHGRHTYAPGMVRDAVKLVQGVRPDWKPKPDSTVKYDPVSPSDAGIRSDWLDDLVAQREDWR